MGTILAQQEHQKWVNRMSSNKKVRWSMLLSHHPPSQYCRTYKILNLRFCARCSGIPIGIIIYIFLLNEVNLILLLILPLPTFGNFLIQELGLIKSMNYLKTLLTIPLGIYLSIVFIEIMSGNLWLTIFLVFYLIGIEFLVAKILEINGKLEPLIQLYEQGVYEENHTQQCAKRQ